MRNIIACICAAAILGLGVVYSETMAGCQRVVAVRGLGVQQFVVQQQVVAPHFNRVVAVPQRVIVRNQLGFRQAVVVNNGFQRIIVPQRAFLRQRVIVQNQRFLRQRVVVRRGLFGPRVLVRRGFVVRRGLFGRIADNIAVNRAIRLQNRARLLGF